MSNHAVIHEPLMNSSRIILPRVGVGVGVGGRGGSKSPIHDVSPFARAEWMAADAARFGGER